jgi:predicted membrane channel-forming protein YqfA (hemolysin III family)
LGVVSTIERMKDSRVRFAVYVAVWTSSVALMLTGVNGSLLLGMACILLSSLFSQRQSRNKTGRHVALVICLIVAIIDFEHNWRHGNIFKREPLGIWWSCLFVVAWLFGVIDEFYRWRSSRSVINVCDKLL